MVLVHGATWSGRPDFDLQIRDYSAMDAFARAGWDVFAPDIQGYGNSDEPKGQSWSRTGDATQDLAAAIEAAACEPGGDTAARVAWARRKRAGVLLGRGGGAVPRLARELRVILGLDLGVRVLDLREVREVARLGRPGLLLEVAPNHGVLGGGRVSLLLAGALREVRLEPASNPSRWTPRR